MKVYFVESGEYDDYSVDRVFSTREKAEKFAFDPDNAPHPETAISGSRIWYFQIYPQVVEVDVDADGDEDRRTRDFTVTINADGGVISSAERDGWYSPPSSVPFRSLGGVVTVQSCTSAEHALWLARAVAKYWKKDHQWNEHLLPE